MTKEGRIWILVGVAVLAVAAVVLAIVLGTEGGEPQSGTGETAQVVDSVFEGIPQKGEVLGDPDAPVVVMEFADLQCPFCAQYANEVLPTLVEEYVRPGRVRMRLRLLAFLGDDSVRGARAAYAASLQNRMWEFVENFFVNQGPENSGYATDDFLRDQADGIEGLDVEKLFADRDSPQVDELLQATERDATRLRVDSTPTFYAGASDGRVAALEVEGLDVESFRAALDAELEPSN